MRGLAFLLLLGGILLLMVGGYLLYNSRARIAERRAEMSLSREDVLAAREDKQQGTALALGGLGAMGASFALLALTGIRRRHRAQALLASLDRRTTRVRLSWDHVGCSLIGAAGAGGIVLLLLLFRPDYYLERFGLFQIFDELLGLEATLMTAVILLTALSVLALAFAFFGAGVSACPACHERQGGLSLESNHPTPCENCGNYFAGEAGLLWQLEDTYLADTPTFCAPLPRSPIFPDVCCVCGVRTTDCETVTLWVPVAETEAKRTAVTFDVPHCAQHKGGARVGGGSAPDRWRIEFRSYAYLRAFCRLNGTAPV